MRPVCPWVILRIGWGEVSAGRGRCATEFFLTTHAPPTETARTIGRAAPDPPPGRALFKRLNPNNPLAFCKSINSRQANQNARPGSVAARPRQFDQTLLLFRHQDLALADMVGGRHQPLFLHLLHQTRGLVIADRQFALDVGCRTFAILDHDGHSRVI